MWLYAFLSVVMIINRTIQMQVIPIDKRTNNRDIYSIGTRGLFKKFLDQLWGSISDMGNP